LPVDGGTQLQLEHKGFESEVPKLSQPMRLAQERQENFMPKTFLETRMLEPAKLGMAFPVGDARVDNFDRVTLNFYLSGGWHSVLNNSLQNLLTDMAEQGCLVL
jgi:hypothetical protein